MTDNKKPLPEIPKTPLEELRKAEIRYTQERAKILHASFPKGSTIWVPVARNEDKRPPSVTMMGYVVAMISGDVIKTGEGVDVPMRHVWFVEIRGVIMRLKREVEWVETV